MKNIDDCLNILGLSKKWIDYGVVPIDKLCDFADKAKYNKTIIDHAPSYFISEYLGKKDNLVLLDVMNCVDIIEAESNDIFLDINMLINHSSMTLDFLTILKNNGLFDRYKMTKKYESAVFFVNLRTNPLKISVLEKAALIKNTEIQTKVLELSQENEDILLLLVKNGSTKKIRNVARNNLQKLRSFPTKVRNAT